MADETAAASEGEGRSDDMKHRFEPVSGGHMVCWACIIAMQVVTG